MKMQVGPNAPNSNYGYDNAFQLQTGALFHNPSNFQSHIFQLVKEEIQTLVPKTHRSLRKFFTTNVI